STVRIRLTNTAPRTGLPSLVTQRLDLPRGARFKSGSSHSMLFLYATHGASYTDGTIDGRPLLLSQQDSYGHTLYSTTFDLAPGQTSDLVVHLEEPVVTGSPYAPVQPLVSPMPIHVNVPICR